MERERERREWEQNELQELEDLQAKHARIDERLEVNLQPCWGFRIVAALTQTSALLLLTCCTQPTQKRTPWGTDWSIRTSAIPTDPTGARKRLYNILLI